MKRNFVLIWLLLALALSAFAQTPIRKPTSASGGSGVTDGDKGDVTISGTGATYTVDANAITFAKMVQISSGGILGRATAGTGNIEALTAAQARTLLGLATTDAATFGTVAVVKEWGGANASNLIFSGRAYGDTARIDFIHTGGTIAAPSRTLNGAYMLRLGVRGTDNAGTPTISNSPRASLIAAATESFTASAQGTQWIITTTPNGSLTEQSRVTIDQDGRFKLHGLSGTGSRFLIADSNNYFDVQTVSQARTLLGLGVADSVVFGTISASKDWGSVSASNVIAKYSSFGDANRFVFSRGNGTAASPTQTLAEQVIFNIQARGYDNTGAESAASRASFNAIAAENFTTTAQGVKWLFTTTPNGSTSSVQALQLNDTGSVRLPQLAGSGNRILNVDNNGDIGAQSSAVTPRTYSGAYSIFPKNSTGDSSGSYTANTVYFYKASEPDAITINRIGTYVFTGSAGATVDIGFYSSDCATKLISTGATDVTSSSTSLAVTVTGTTISGGVCVMWTTSSATPTYQQLTWAANAWRFANSNGATPILGTCSNTASGGALPASCGTLTSSNTLAPIAVRAWVN